MYEKRESLIWAMGEVIKDYKSAITLGLSVHELRHIYMNDKSCQLCKVSKEVTIGCHICPHITLRGETCVDKCYYTSIDPLDMSKRISQIESDINIYKSERCRFVPEFVWGVVQLYQKFRWGGK